MKIAICGKMRTGKDVLASQIIGNYGFTGFKFSAGITEIISNYFPRDISQNRKLREHYQHIGQSMRKLDRDVWVQYTHEQINQFVSENGVYSDILVSDLRQSNEYDYLKANDFIIIKVESDRDKRIERAMGNNDNFQISDLDHETEKSVEAIQADYVIRNNGTLEEYLEEINRMMIHVMMKELDR